MDLPNYFDMFEQFSIRMPVDPFTGHKAIGKPFQGASKY
jgi:hypothetical protein